MAWGSGVGVITGIIGDALLLELGLSDGNVGKFPRVTLYAADTALEATVDLVHTAAGMYQGTYVPAALGHFSASYIVYNEVGRTTIATEYEQTADHVFVRNDTGADLDFLRKVLTNRRETNPATGRLDIYNDADDAVEFSVPIFEDVGATQPYRELGVNRQNKIV